MYIYNIAINIYIYTQILCIIHMYTFHGKYLAEKQSPVHPKTMDMTSSCDFQEVQQIWRFPKSWATTTYPFITIYRWIFYHKTIYFADSSIYGNPHIDFTGSTESSRHLHFSARYRQRRLTWRWRSPVQRPGLHRNGHHGAP